MTTHLCRRAIYTLALVLIAAQCNGETTPTDRITILYDAFGRNPAMKKDWGFAALVEIGGKRILFDTGNNPDVFAQNVKAASVDLGKLDFVVMSHRHGDHMGGMPYLLSKNPHVKIYAPQEGFGVHGASLPGSFYRADASLPEDMRYFDGKPPEVLRFGAAWPTANIQLIDKTTEVAPGIRLIAQVSDAPGTKELKELSLAIDTPEGIVLIVGCAHPGIESIVAEAAAINPRMRLVTGGFHLVTAQDPVIDKIVAALHDTYKVERIAPAHCSGEHTFATIKRIFGDHYQYAGVGTVMALGTDVNARSRAGADDDREERLTAYLRTGRYADARRLIDQMLATEPRDDLKNVRAVYASAPNMRIRRASATFACEVRDNGVSLPITVEGTPVQWLIDTGLDVTMVSDAEAARLGLVIRGADGRAADLAGGSTRVRTAIARRVLIGRTLLQDVPFLVMPASQMPWKELPPGKQGILGLPVAIALDALRWTKTGMCYTGSAAGDRSSPSRPANLRYHRSNVITEAEFEGRTLEFLLDTGNQAGTQLWERFGKDFEPLVKERGRKGSVRVTQIGGSTDPDVILIPGIRLKVGGKETTLGEGQLFSRPVGDDQFHGLLGMDVLSQAADVTIDFKSMTLTLR